MQNEFTAAFTYKYKQASTMLKTVNFILGAGFSKSIAKKTTGYELSIQVFDYFVEIQEKSSIAKNLLDVPRRSSNGYSSEDCQAFSKEKVRKWYNTVVFCKYSQFIQELHYLKLAKDEEVELLNYQRRIIRDHFNYESVAGELQCILISLNRLQKSQSEDYREAQRLLQWILKLIHDELSESDFDNYDVKQINTLTRLFLENFIDKGYTINIFDLNHDNVFEIFCKNSMELSIYYNNFFEEYKDIDQEFPERVSHIFNKSQKNRINHYKLHGSFEIFDRVSRTLGSRNSYKLEKLPSSDYFFKEALLEIERTEWCYTKAPTLLCNDLFKTYSISKSPYLSFCFCEFNKVQENLITIGYSKNDPHINSVISNNLDINIRNPELLESNVILINWLSKIDQKINCIYQATSNNTYKTPQGYMLSDFLSRIENNILKIDL